MKVRFDGITQALALAFLIAGIGAGSAMLSAGDQTTPGSGSDRLVLFALAVICAAVAVGLFFESVWAWWAGAAIAAAVTILDLVLGADGGWVLWIVALAGFATSGVRGQRATASSARGR